MLQHEEFVRLAEKYTDTVFRIAFSYTNSRSDAEDVTQDVLLSLYRANKIFESEEHIKYWLIRVTINQCKKLLRSPWRKVERLEDYAQTIQFDDAFQRELFYAVSRLETKYRTVVLLYYYDGYSTKEIAQLLRVPQNTVSTRLSRARKLLKSVLTEVEYD